MGEWSDWYAREDPSTWVLAEVLKKRASETPDRDYLKFADNPWVSYGEVNARANRIANSLIARGVQPGESVSVMLPNCEEFIPVWFGILKAGAVMSSINTAYKGDFLSWTINLVEAKKLVISDLYLDRLDLIKGELPLLEHVIVMKTGAQEGPDPSLTWEPLDALMEGCGRRAGRDHLLLDRRRPDHVHLGHDGPLQGRHQAERGRLLLGPRPAGGRLGDRRQVGRVARRGHLLQLPAALPLQRPGALGLPGAGGRRPGRLRGALLLEHASGSRSRTPRRRSSTRSARVSYFIWNIPPSDLDRAHKVHTCFAAPAPKDIYNEFQERFGVKFIEGYGLTETGMATYMDPTKPGVPGSMGKANPGYEVTIVEPGTDRPLPPDTPGEIVVNMKIPNIVMRAYYGMPEKTAEDFRNLKLHTGDLGRMDEEGYFYFMDRVKDYIRRRGENVSSMEVERQASDHPNIKEAAAIGVKAGEGASSEDEIMIVCIPEGDAPDPVEYTHWMAERMPYFMVPRYIRFVPELPKTPTERVQKVKLRDEGITADTFDREAAGITIKR